MRNSDSLKNNYVGKFKIYCVYVDLLMMFLRPGSINIGFSMSNSLYNILLLLLLLFLFYLPPDAPQKRVPDWVQEIGAPGWTQGPPLADLQSRTTHGACDPTHFQHRFLLPRGGLQGNNVTLVHIDPKCLNE